MARKRIKICSIYLILMGVITIGFGLLCCFTPRPMPEQLAFVGMELDEINDVNPKIVELMLFQSKVSGFCLLGLGVITIGMSSPFRQGQRWAWLTLLPAVLVVLIPMLVITTRIGSLSRWGVMTLLVLFVAAMLAPVRDFFGNVVGSIISPPN